MNYKVLLTVVAMASLIVTLGCSQKQRSPDSKAGIEKALGQANLGSVNVSQDRDKGVITLSGDVLAEADKQKAEEVARSVSPSFVIANQIGVRPVGVESEAKQVDSSLDTAIEKNLEAILVGKHLNEDIKYTATNGVLTLKGEVNSIEKRHELEQLAGSVPNVKQVVNELQITELKATSRK
jgi:hyperosmotically inducible periplasmic protein